MKSSEKIRHRLTRCTLAQFRTHKSFLHKGVPNHVHHPYSPTVTFTYRTHIISSTTPTYNHVVAPGFVDRRNCFRRSCWWTLSGKIGVPLPLTRVKGVGQTTTTVWTESSNVSGSYTKMRYCLNKNQ